VWVPLEQTLLQWQLLEQEVVWVVVGGDGHSLGLGSHLGPRFQSDEDIKASVVVVSLESRSAWFLAVGQ